ncbi:hypothetical protein GOB88_10720 [Acetobacter lovaniensis]|nr:hypothetical protein [Acetobacter lovaniensis]
MERRADDHYDRVLADVTVHLSVQTGCLWRWNAFFQTYPGGTVPDRQGVWCLAVRY